MLEAELKKTVNQNKLYLIQFINLIKEEVKFNYNIICFSNNLILKVDAKLFFSSKREFLPNWEKCFLFHFKSSFHSRENQILEFCIFKFHDVIKCLSTKEEIHFTE